MDINHARAQYYYCYGVMQAFCIRMMGNCLSFGQASVRELCNNEWNLYTQHIDEHGSRHKEQHWAIILDDLHHLAIETTSQEISVQFADVVEKILLGCKEVISRELHDQFVEIIVRRVKEIIEFDFRDNKQLNQVIELFRSTEDSQKGRETSVMFVMAIRLTKTSKRQESEGEDREISTAPTIIWESCFRIRLHSYLLNRPAVTQRVQNPRSCTPHRPQIQISGSLPATFGQGIVTRLDPT